MDKTFVLNAYEILMGTERLSTVGKDPMMIISFKDHQSQLAGISSTLNDAHGIWDFTVNDLEANSHVFAAQGIVTCEKGTLIMKKRPTPHMVHAVLGKKTSSKASYKVQCICLRYFRGQLCQVRPSISHPLSKKVAVYINKTISKNTPVL